MTSISIAIATFNRCQELARTLEGFQLLPFEYHGNYEILVIDNNSTDETKAVVRDFADRFNGPVRYIAEEKQGLSHARNRAIAEAQYEVVAFLDDDVNLEVGWLPNLAAAYEQGNAAAVGGRAFLLYPEVRPNWLGIRDEGYLTKVELGPRQHPAKADELFGVNLSVKKQWVQRVGGFRTDLGRIGMCLLGSEETELLERIANAGGELWYEPKATVGHRVDPRRLRRRWFWSRSYWGHRGEARRLPREQVSLYELTRTTWHIAIATGNLVRATLGHGPLGEQAFHEILVLAARLGLWRGMLGRLTGHERPVSTACPSPAANEPFRAIPAESTSGAL